MGIKDQIRAEIERQKEINKKLLDGQLRDGCLYAFNQVLSFLDSLPEQPDGLEEAAKEYATKWHKRPDGSEWKSIFPKGAIRDFIAGAEWMKAKMLEEAVEIEVKEDAGGYPIVPLDAIELYDYEKDKPLAKAGDKVKVIVIKEDEK